jgi:hypothetical protein
MTSLEDDEDAGTTSACSEAVARKGTQSVEVPRVTLTKTQPLDLVCDLVVGRLVGFIWPLSALYDPGCCI